MMAQTYTAVEDEIIKLFDEFSDMYSWSKEMSANIHYYNGWKTNKSWKINEKVIIPLSGFDRYYSNGWEFCYKAKDKLTDVVKVFNYLSFKKDNEINVKEILKYAEEKQHIYKY